MGAKEYTFTVLFEPAEEGGYVATCLALPGLVTEGDTLAEAREMAKDASERTLRAFARINFRSLLIRRSSLTHLRRR